MATSDCAGKAATPVCDTAAAKCVACLTDAQCGGATPICATATHTCRACAADTECSAKSGTTACALTGTNVGRCVQCVDNGKCSGTTPICATTTNTCRGCTADAECSAIGPGVCMNHHDSRCASDAETEIVKAGDSLPDTAALSGKRLLLVRGSVAGGIAWNLTTLGAFSMVGQGTGATVKGSATSNGLAVAGGELYVRNVTFSGASNSNGITVSAGKLTLEHVTITGNQNGLSCASGTTVSASAASGFLAKGNSDTDVSTRCTGVTSCDAPSLVCGAQ